MREESGKGPLVVLVGPTAVGKTALAIELALALNGEVVTADSMQVYKGMDIGTAKPTPSEMKGVPHHLIDVVTPDTPFNVALYRDMAHRVIAEVHARGRVPIVSGGTGLYIRAVLDEFLFRTKAWIRPALSPAGNARSTVPNTCTQCWLSRSRARRRAPSQRRAPGNPCP